jgi:hypothetical protein
LVSEDDISNLSYAISPLFALTSNPAFPILVWVSALVAIVLIFTESGPNLIEKALEFDFVLDFARHFRRKFY